MEIVKFLNTKINIVDLIGKYTELTQTGNVYRGCCPIHGSEEGTPLVVYPATNSYYCFACESGGGPINFYADMENIPYSTAIEALAKEYNVNIDRDDGYKTAQNIEKSTERRAALAHKKLSDSIVYLKKRGFTEDTLNTFCIGTENGDIIIPIRTEYGQYCAIAKRTFSGKAKYINSYNNALYDKSALLYGLDIARKMLKDRKEIYLVEGYMDCMSGYQMGVPTVAYCSAQLHEDQIRTLSRFVRDGITIMLCFDNDEEGLKKVEAVRNKLQIMLPRLQVRAVVMPDDCKDLNDLLINGLKVQDLPSIHIDRFALNQKIVKCKTLEEEYDMVYDYLKTVRNPIIKLEIVKEMASRWGKPFEEVAEYFKAPKEDTDELVKNASGTEDCINDLKRLYSRGEYKTGFMQLDNCIGGLSKKQVFVVGAYSGSGKSDFAIEYILRQIVQNKSRTVFFSLEMPKGKVMERMIAKITQCPLNKVRELIETNDEVIKKVIEKLNNLLVIYDENDLTMADIDRRVTAINQKNILGGPVDLVVLDYFTYLKGANTFEGASEQALMMKGIAKRHNIIFCVLSQISRKGNTYEEPTMDMLRMTGDIEASADVILMMWRPDRQPNLSLEEEEKLQYITRMKVEKARDGVYGPTRLEFKYNILNARLEENIKGRN